MTCFRMITGETVKKCCERLGVSYAKAYGWLNKGLSADEAVRMAIEYKSIRNLCKENGICYDSVIHRHIKTSASCADFVSTSEDYYKIIKHFVLKRGGTLEDDVKRSFSNLEVPRRNRSIYCRKDKDLYRK